MHGNRADQHGPDAPSLANVLRGVHSGVAGRHCCIAELIQVRSSRRKEKFNEKDNGNERKKPSRKSGNPLLCRDLCNGR